MRCEFHGLVLLPGDFRIRIRPSSLDAFVLLLKTSITTSKIDLVAIYFGVLDDC